MKPLSTASTAKCSAWTSSTTRSPSRNRRARPGAGTHQQGPIGTPVSVWFAETRIGWKRPHAGARRDRGRIPASQLGRYFHRSPTVGHRYRNGPEEISAPVRRRDRFIPTPSAEPASPAAVQTQRRAPAVLSPSDGAPSSAKRADWPVFRLEGAKVATAAFNSIRRSIPRLHRGQNTWPFM